jgi:hypothetical protein
MIILPVMGILLGVEGRAVLVRDGMRIEISALRFSKAGAAGCGAELGGRERRTVRLAALSARRRMLEARRLDPCDSRGQPPM